MQYTVTREIRPRKESSLNRIYLFVILLIAVPVIVIAAISLLFIMMGAAVISLFKQHKLPPADEPYKVERVMLKNDFLEILAVDNEQDLELSRLNELWTRTAYHEDTYLYRALTTPLVPALHGCVICFYLNERPGGAILQKVGYYDMERGHISTDLVYLDYDNLQVVRIEELGTVHLYNDPGHPGTIRGFNDNEEVILTLTAKS